MRVGVYGLRNGGMAEHLLNDLRVDVLGEKQGSARVAQAVKGEAFTLVLGPEPCPLQQGFEVTMVEGVVVLHQNLPFKAQSTPEEGPYKDCAS